MCERWQCDSSVLNIPQPFTLSTVIWNKTRLNLPSGELLKIMKLRQFINLYILVYFLYTEWNGKKKSLGDRSDWKGSNVKRNMGLKMFFFFFLNYPQHLFLHASVFLLVAKHFYNTGWESSDDRCNSRIPVLNSECDLAPLVRLQPLCSVAEEGHPFSDLLWNVWFYGSSVHR